MLYFQPLDRAYNEIEDTLKQIYFQLVCIRYTIWTPDVATMFSHRITIFHTRVQLFYSSFFFFFFTVIQISFSLQSIILPIHFYNRSSIFYSLHQNFWTFKFLNTRIVKFCNLRFVEYSSFQVLKFTN